MLIVSFAGSCFRNLAVLGPHVASPVELSVLGLSRPVCSSVPSDVRLSAAQNKLCSMYPDHMNVVRRGARLGLEECQWQFQTHRWNCSTVFYTMNQPVMTPMTTTTTAAPLSQDTEDAITDVDGGHEVASVATNLSSPVVVGDPSAIALAELLNPSITIGILTSIYARCFVDKWKKQRTRMSPIPCKWFRAY